jgi:hypothetical protein
MSTAAPDSVKRSRWLDWKPQARILADSPESELTKLTIPGSVSFVGSTSAEFPEIEVPLDPAQSKEACTRLNQAGVRNIQIDGAAVVGVWSDLDGPEIRAALRTLGLGAVPVYFLDGAGIPMRYKLRVVEGEPVPMSVLAEMERHVADPWSVRERMLKEMVWCSKRSTWADWKAATLNRLFQEQGVTGQPGQITAAIVRHGEAGYGRKSGCVSTVDCAATHEQPMSPVEPTE